LKDMKASQESLSEEQLEELTQRMGALFEVLLTEAPHKEKVKTSAELLSLLTALELGDHTTATRVYLQNRVKSHFAQVQQQIRSMQVQCQNPETEEIDLPLEGDPRGQVPGAEASSLALSVYGMRFSVATAYQSCQALQEPALRASTPDVQGIKITGRHSDGSGNKREIASLNSV